MASETVFVIEFRWRMEDDEGTGQAIVAGIDAADAERRWREHDPAEWPKYELIDIEPLGDQVLVRYTNE